LKIIFSFSNIGFTFAELKQFAAILLVLVIFLQNFMQLGQVAYYNYNKQMISQQLCENRTSPSLHCNGKCYLSKQLKKTEEQEQKSANSLKEKEELVNFPLAQSFSFAQIPTYSVTKLMVRFQIFIPQHDAKGLFHPPSLA
jgi:hypothetical protein